jgi:hypothetical protein
MMISNKKFLLSTDDDRRRQQYRELVKDVMKVLKMEPSKTDPDVLVVFSANGHMLNRKLYNIISRFQKYHKKCYVYSKYSNSVREIIRIEKGDFPDTGIYGVVIHSGMKISEYNVYQNIITDQK